MNAHSKQEISRRGRSLVDDPRWTGIVARDRSADGEFWYSVSTTGVYCRPSCPSRGCNPENVAIHGSLEAAKATGFRAGRRCRPDGRSIDQANAAAVAKACQLIDEAEEEPTLAEIAVAVKLSPHH